MKMKNRKGFTLVEMVVTIAILSILATTAIAVLNPFAQFQKANDAKRMTDLSQIQKALETYYQDHQSYPPQNGANDYRINDGRLIDWGKSWQPYMNVIPKDPSSNKNYVYSVGDNGQSYFIYASLDRVNSSNQCSGADPCGSTKCVGTCNFGISSPNKTP
jgi:type II secretion system protein G